MIVVLTIITITITITTLTLALLPCFATYLVKVSVFSEKGSFMAIISFKI